MTIHSSDTVLWTVTVFLNQTLLRFGLQAFICGESTDECLLNADKTFAVSWVFESKLS